MITTDFNLYDNDINEKPIINDELEAFAQEIEVFLTTGIVDVIDSENDDWIDLESMVFKFRVNKQVMESKINDGIAKNCSLASKYRFKSTVEFLQGSLDDIAVINTHIYDHDDRGGENGGKVLNLIIS